MVPFPSCSEPSHCARAVRTAIGRPPWLMSEPPVLHRLRAGRTLPRSDTMEPPDAPRESPIGLARRLIARQEYEAAIELMREQMQGRTPTALLRLQFADVLLRAGRGKDALPVLMALADEFAAEGYVARAIAVL